MLLCWYWWWFWCWHDVADKILLIWRCWYGDADMMMLIIMMLMHMMILLIFEGGGGENECLTCSLIQMVRPLSIANCHLLCIINYNCHCQLPLSVVFIIDVIKIAVFLLIPKSLLLIPKVDLLIPKVSAEIRSSPWLGSGEHCGISRILSLICLYLCLCLCHCQCHCHSHCHSSLNLCRGAVWPTGITVVLSAGPNRTAR